MMSTQGSEVRSSASPRRQHTDFHPSSWGNYFLTFIPEIIDTTTEEEHKALKEEVRKMISRATNVTVQKVVVQLIDTIQHLGVAYHFEKEIEDALQKIFHDLLADNNIDGDDLYIVSLRFRLLRQQGIMISCDVFNKFKQEEGISFKKSLKKDVEGMLSLYEAAYLAIHGEEILNEAIALTTTHLKSMLPHVSPNLAQLINHALYRPLRKALPRLEARFFIDIYAREHDTHDQTLLKFAKLDFNILQAQHQRELHGLTRWCRDIDFSTKLQYARDRFVGVYFWAMGFYFEPKYALGRKILTKIIYVSSAIEDTFDAYGTFEELRLFTEAVKRWDIGAIDILPEYMKTLYKTLLDIYTEIEEELAKEGRSHCVRYAKEKVKEAVMFYFEEAKWLNEGFFPTMEGYNSVALPSTCIPMLVTNSFLGMGDLATEDAFKWMFSNPKIITAASVIGRFLDDIAGHEFEQKREHIPSAVECYMKQYAVSEEEAVKLLKQEVENAWKDINEEFLINNNNPSAVQFPLLKPIFNFSRTFDFYYKGGECYTHSYLMKDQVASLLRDPVL